MRHLALPLCLVLFAAAPAPHPATELVEAERSLDHDAALLGPRETFLRWLAPSAIEFRPGPVAALPVYRALAPTPSAFRRRVAEAVVASSGDLGWTTGEWVFKADSAKRDTDACGAYVSVWARQPDGAWRIVFDAGVPHPMPPDAATPPRMRTLAVRRDGRGAPGDRRWVWRADSAYAAAAAEGAGAAFARDAAVDAEAIRGGRRRLTGAAARDTLAGEGAARLESQAQSISSAGDLGYTYGTLVRTTAAGPDTSHYLHIWERTGARWRLALDYVEPMPRRRR